MNPRISEIHGAQNDFINDSLIKLELTIVIDVPPARSRAWAQKGKLISQNCGTCYATSQPEIISARALLPSAITNEPPVIENNRCVRVMPPEDRVLARGSASLYELAESASTPSRRRENSTTTTRWCMCSQPYPFRVQTFRVTYISTHLQPPLPHPFTLVRSFIKGDCLLPLCSSPSWIRRRLVHNSHPIYVPRNCEVHYRVTT